MGTKTQEQEESLVDRLKTTGRKAGEISRLYLDGVLIGISGIHAFPTVYATINNPDFNPIFSKESETPDHLSISQRLTGVAAGVSSLLVVGEFYEHLANLTETNAVYLTPLVTNTASALFEGVRRLVHNSYKKYAEQRVALLEKAIRESDRPTLYDQIAIELFKDKQVRVVSEWNDPDRSVMGFKHWKISVESRNSKKRNSKLFSKHLGDILERNPLINDYYTEKESVIDGIGYRRLIRGSFGATPNGFVPIDYEYDIVNVSWSGKKF